MIKEDLKDKGLEKNEVVFTSISGTQHKGKVINIGNSLVEQECKVILPSKELVVRVFLEIARIESFSLQIVPLLD